MDFEKYILWYLVSFCAILFGSRFGNQRSFYKSLILPPFAPEPFVYAIVWTSLYLLNATGCCLLQNHNDGDWSLELTLYLIFIGVSSLFTWVFFSLKNLIFSLLIMLASSALIILTTTLFFLSYDLAAWFILPTAIWVVFATYLMVSICINNPMSDPKRTKNVQVGVFSFSKDKSSHKKKTTVGTEEVEYIFED